MGQPQIFEHLDVLISTTECGSDEAAQQLDLLHAPLLAQLQAGRPQGAVVALSLLATLCEQQPGAAAELRLQGAVPSVAQHLLHGEWVHLGGQRQWFVVCASNVEAGQRARDRPCPRDRA